jgi:hypothetical protein
MKSLSPFTRFRLEKRIGEYKDFHLGADNAYPLAGVTYLVDYGDIGGYVAEDGADLDLFVGGKEDGFVGYIRVARPELKSGETKVYIDLSETEEAAVLTAFQLVLLSYGRYASYDELMRAIAPFKVSA